MIFKLRMGNYNWWNEKIVNGWNTAKFNTGCEQLLYSFFGEHSLEYFRFLMVEMKFGIHKVFEWNDGLWV